MSTQLQSCVEVWPVRWESCSQPIGPGSCRIAARPLNGDLRAQKLLQMLLQNAVPNCCCTLPEHAGTCLQEGMNSMADSMFELFQACIIQSLTEGFEACRKLASPFSSTGQARNLVSSQSLMSQRLLSSDGQHAEAQFKPRATVKLRRVFDIVCAGQAPCHSHEHKALVSALRQCLVMPCEQDVQTEDKIGQREPLTISRHFRRL